MATLEEIARLSKTSRSTVSRVINDDPHVSQATRDRVMAMVRQLNYHPNLAARSLVDGRTHVLGLVIPMGVARLFTDPYFPILIQGAASACNANKHTVMLWLAEPEYERQMVNQILYNGLVDGVIVASSLIDDSLIESLLKSSLRFVMIGRPLSNLELSYVDVDNKESARQAVHYLLRAGRRQIATITGPQNMIAGLDRLEGYRTALREWGLAADPGLIANGSFSEAGGYEAMCQLLSKSPDAVFAASDAMAIGAMRALRDAGRRIPEDVAIVGFDNMPFAERAEPPLTTVRQPIQRAGALAVETLIDMIENPDSSPRRIVLPTELVIRQSS
jgi:LacI family transcriptional regulator